MNTRAPKLVGVIEGELVKEAVLADWEMSQQNFAREEFQRLENLLRQVVMPGLGGYDNPLVRELDLRIEQTRNFSQNFCWRHRAMGASVDAREVRQ
ncbi:hypothetical protein D9M68_796790 [compost metagenome]